MRLIRFLLPVLLALLPALLAFQVSALSLHEVQHVVQNAGAAHGFPSSHQHASCDLCTALHAHNAIVSQGLKTEPVVLWQRSSDATPIQVPFTKVLGHADARAPPSVSSLT